MDERPDRYEGSSLRFMLGVAAAFIPGGGVLNALENGLLDRQKRLREDRLRELVRHLELDAVTLQEAVDSDEGLHAIVVVIDAVQRDQAGEKQRAFAKLLFQYLRSGDLSKNAPEFEYFFDILDDLTQVEFRMLLILSGFELEESDKRTALWTEARAKMSQALGIDGSAIDARLFRLTRTGLCTKLDVWGGPMFAVSPLYEQFVQYLELGNYRSP